MEPSVSESHTTPSPGLFYFTFYFSFIFSHFGEKETPKQKFVMQPSLCCFALLSLLASLPRTFASEFCSVTVSMVLTRRSLRTLADVALKLNPSLGETITVNTETSAWTVSYVVSVFQPFSCPGIFTVSAFVTVDSTTYTASTPDIFALPDATGVITRSGTWTQITLATATPQIVYIVTNFTSGS